MKLSMSRISIRLPRIHCDSFFLYFSEQEKLVERLAGEISKYKKELKVMKNETKKRKENENKITQVTKRHLQNEEELINR